MKKDLFVEGMHCASCELFIEKSLSTHSQIKSAKANRSDQSVRIETLGDDTISEDALISELNELLADSTYRIRQDKPVVKSVNYSEVAVGFIIASIFVLLFIGLQYIRLINFLNTDTVSLPFVFGIGVIASVSSCAAVVGGLVLSLAGIYARDNQKNKIVLITSFHLSRLIGFFIFGGLIGIIGSAFTLTPLMSFILNIILFIVMILMGLNLIELFPALYKFQLRLPKNGLFKHIDGHLYSNKYAPIILGATTFFLPCGFTQSMQLYSLTTGHFITGALTMLVFALGTLPALSLVSFASMKLGSHPKSGIFFKTAGFIVFFFALHNLYEALLGMGIISPVLSF